jgi:hypothetical protein
MKEYKKIYKNLSLAQIEMLHEIQEERLTDLHTGDITGEGYDKLQDRINNKLAHLQLAT